MKARWEQQGHQDNEHLNDQQHTQDTQVGCQV